MLDNTEGAIKTGQLRDTGDIGHTRRRQTKQKIQHYALDTNIRKQAQIIANNWRTHYPSLVVVDSY
jgi:hypothetical protein